ncbi:hypothetical protein GCM10009722_19560 [Williamsia deligens]|nr:hypothetical protein [Williamsia deligens]
MKSIADHVASGDSLAETARALDVAEDEVNRWAHEMMLILRVDTVTALADQLRRMQYGAPTTQPWDRSLFVRKHADKAPAESVA